MKLELKRTFFGTDYTIGHLYVDGEYFCDTMEPTVRPKGIKVVGRTAIPEGTYSVIVTMSPRFRRLLPLLECVPGFEGIRIHAGNTFRDTEGCILVGFNTKQGYVLSSKVALNNLMNTIEDKCTITISSETKNKQV